MRALLLVASVLLIVGANASLRDFEEQISRFDAADKFAKLKHMAAAGHGFSAQQSDLLTPASDDPVCQEAAYTQLLIGIYTTCQAQLMPLQNSTLKPTPDAHREGWATYCASTCFTQIRTQVIGSKYWICLQPLIQYGAAQAYYLCMNKDAAGDVCGLSVSRLTFVSACGSALSQASCSAIGGGTCAWTGQYCQANPTNTLLGALCGTCLTGLSKEVGSKYPTLDAAAGLIEASRSLCSTAPSGAYCLPLLATSTSAGSTMFQSSSAMQAFCSSDDMVACMGAFVAANVHETVDSARRTFVSCARSYNNASAQVNQNCLSRFLTSVASAQATSAIVSALCTANSNGVYCIPAFYTLQAQTSGNRACPTNISGLLSDLGCCVGTAQSMANTIATTSVDPSLFPVIPGYTPPVVQATVAPAPATSEPVTLAAGEELSPNPGNGGFFAFAACGVTGLNQTLRKRCAQAKFKVSKNLLLKLDYAVVTADPSVKAAVLASLRRDVAANAGVSPNQITDDSISSTSRVQVTTSGRGLQVQATSNGVQYSYTIQASSKAQAQAAANSIDGAVKEGFIPLDNTQATVQSSCPACVGSGKVASIGQVSSTTVGNSVGGSTSTSSGAAAVGTLLAIIVATLALLL